MPKRMANSPKADKIRANEIFIPPTMKNNGVMNAYDTVLRRCLTTWDPDDSLK